MIEKIVKHLISALSVSVVAGCGSSDVAGATGVGNPNGQPTIITVSAENGVSVDPLDTFINNSESLPVNSRSKSTETTEDTDLTDSSGASFSVSAMSIVIDSISWSPSDETAAMSTLSGNVHRTGRDLVAVGPWTVDLLTGSSIAGSPISVALPEATYNGVRFYVGGDKHKPSVDVRGVVSKGEEIVPYRISLPIEMTLKFDSKQPVFFGGEKGEHLELLFNSDLWLLDIDAFAIGDKIGDTLVIAKETISGGENGSVHVFRNGIRKSGVLRLKK